LGLILGEGDGRHEAQQRGRGENDKKAETHVDSGLQGWPG
jgi:hypothetical protein